MRAVLLVDEILHDRADPHFIKRRPRKYFEAEFHAGDALRKLGHEVVGIAATSDVGETIGKITAARPDFVFNMVEEIAGRRDNDGKIVGVLELIGLPYTGASSGALMRSRDKSVSKSLVSQAGVVVPRSVVLSRGMNVQLERIAFPALIKPMFTDGSEGITARSYVSDPATLRRRAAHLMQRFSQPLLCEEFIRGREFYVTLSGTMDVSVDSICELVFPQRSRIKFATERVKFDERYRKRNGIVYRTPARLSARVAALVREAAVAAYRALRIDAYAKLEFRLRDGTVVFIEANPNSHLSRFSVSTDFASIGYEKFIAKIVAMAMRRGRAM